MTEKFDYIGPKVEAITRDFEEIDRLALMKKREVATISFPELMEFSDNVLQGIFDLGLVDCLIEEGHWPEEFRPQIMDHSFSFIVSSLAHPGETWDPNDEDDIDRINKINSHPHHELFVKINNAVYGWKDRTDITEQESSSFQQYSDMFDIVLRTQITQAYMETPDKFKTNPS